MISGTVPYAIGPGVIDRTKDQTRNGCLIKVSEHQTDTDRRLMESRGAAGVHLRSRR